jgi:hypothetical protein
VCQPMLLELGPQEALEEIAHALVELGIDVVMPLLEPRDELRNACQQRLQTLRGPALLFYYLSVPGCQGSRLLQVVPAGPGDQQRRVGLPRAERIADEAFLRDIEGTAQPPEGAVLEVSGGVFGRRWGVADLLLLAAPLFGLQTLLKLRCRLIRTHLQ